MQVSLRGVNKSKLSISILDTRKKEFEAVKYSFEKNSLSNVYLIFGPKKSGKKTFAKEVAKAILCEKNIETLKKPCLTCVSCVEFEKGTNPSFSFLGKKEASFSGKDRNSIEFFRDFEFQKKAYQKSDKKNVFVIPEIEEISDEAGSFLLKTLEDAPKNTLFLLTSNKKEKVFKTILSRSVLIPFPHLSKKDFEVFSPQILGKNIEANEIYLRCAGSIKKAIETEEEKNFWEKLFLIKNEKEALSFSEKIVESVQKNENPRKEALKLVELVLDFLSWKLKEEKQKTKLLRAIEETLYSLENIQKNGNIKLNLDLVLLNIAWITN